ncbi:MAG: Cytidylate kinase (Cytidine monophosphate kinase) kinase, partial [Pseudomonadota bacterium]
DGPSGAGKGTVSRAIARELGWHYLDSGSIYRALAYSVISHSIELTDVSSIAELAMNLNLTFVANDELQIYLDQIEITQQLISENTANAASIIAAYPQIRQMLLQKQRDFKQSPGLVADGRDMGTVVFPQACYKVFLTASVAERANRRYKQLIKKGINANLDRITHEIELRDRRDRERDIAPLMQADQAVYLDSSNLPIAAVIEAVLKLIR